MNSDLLKQFLEEDCDPYVRNILMKALCEHSDPNHIASREYTFNRFIVRLDFGKREVFLQDDLTPGVEGEMKLGFREFRDAVQGIK